MIHLGDHDPSGMDMTRDIESRLTMLCNYSVEVKRIALNWDQVQQYDPPPNPAKVTDSRAEAYIATFGNESWELDALPFDVLDRLITDEVTSIIDERVLSDVKAREEKAKLGVKAISDNWDAVLNFLRDQELLKDLA